jgi:hypothetical protein
MDPEIKAALERLETVSEQNNRMIRSLYRSNKWNQVFVFIKWAILIGIAIGAFYYLQPIFNKINTIYSTITNSHLPSFQQFINKF